jgi:hypothetical protein
MLNYVELEDAERMATNPPPNRNGHTQAESPVAREPLLPLDIETFLDLALPPRNVLLSPWLPAGGLAMLYAPRGIGKTHLALGIAYAVASGGTFLKWKAPLPQPVLFVDGEMAAVTLQERLARIVSESACQTPAANYFRILPSDLYRDGLPDLSNPEQQAAYNTSIGDAKLVVVDNISTLCRSGRENESESWNHVQGWALQQRRAGRSVLFVHHAGKAGGQRGTSRKEDILDSVLSLRRPENYSSAEGARFEIHYDKARGFSGGDAEPFEAALTAEGWACRDVAQTLEARVSALAVGGLSQRDIARAIGKSAGTVNAILKRGKGA